MLTDLALTCAAFAALAPAAVSVVTGRTDFAAKRTVQRRLYRALLLAEKLPPAMNGGRQIGADIERQTLHLAYLTQFPQRAREIAAIAAIGVVTAAATVAYCAAVWGDSSWFTVLALLGLVVVGALWLNRVVRNFGHNDALTRDLFDALHAPVTLTRPRTELFAKGPVLPVETLLRHAADIRDADHRATMTTVSAVNAALDSVHGHDRWRRDVSALTRAVANTDYRTLARSNAAKAVSLTEAGYHWSLRRVFGPFFDIRLDYLNGRERHRVARALRTGDVYKAAWLATHYRTERERLAAHRAIVGAAPRPQR